MYAVQAGQLAAASGKKPSLAGAKTKQRKGVAKAAAKYEPNVFRDTLIKHFESVPQGDFDAYARKLDDLGNQLDYRKYEAELFQLLLTGRLLAPGGNYIQDGANPSPFSLLTSAKEPVELKDIKSIVEVFNKLIRRFKYLQKDFEESSLPSILQHVNKFDNPQASTVGGTAMPVPGTPTTTAASLPGTDKSVAHLQAHPAVAAAVTDSAPPSRPATPSTGSASTTAVGIPSLGPRPQQDKLAIATAMFVTTGLAGPTVLAAVKKEHLVKDGSALAFLTVYLRTFLQSENIEHLSVALRKGGIHDLIEFFPTNRRSFAELQAHFKKSNLEGVTELYQKQRSTEVSRETLSHLKEMVGGQESNEEIIAYLKDKERLKAIQDADFVALVWAGCISTVDMTLTGQQLSEAIVKELKEVAPIMEAFCQQARSEVALINNIQIWCYENTQALNFFVKILLTLFNADVLSSAAILYWHSKGSKPQARQHFLTQAEPLVKKLEEQEEDEDDE